MTEALNEKEPQRTEGEYEKLLRTVAKCIIAVGVGVIAIDFGLLVWCVRHGQSIQGILFFVFIVGAFFAWSGKLELDRQKTKLETNEKKEEHSGIE